MKKGKKHETLKKAAELCGEIPPINKSSKDVMHYVSTEDLFTKKRALLHRSKKALSYLKDSNLPSTSSGQALKIELGYNSYQSGNKQLQNRMLILQ